MTGLTTGLPSLVALHTYVAGSVTTLAGAVGDRPITSVIALAELGLITFGIRMLFTGRLMTGREADERDKRYQEKEKECRQLRSTLAGMTDAMETCNVMIAAIMKEAQDREHSGPRLGPSSPPPPGRLEGPP